MHVKNAAMKMRMTALACAAILLFAAPNIDMYAGRPTELSMQADGPWFEPNYGQVVDSDGMTRPDVLYTSKVGDVRIYVRSSGISYVFVRGVEPPVDPDAVPDENQVDTLAVPLIESYRVDVEFDGALPQPLTNEFHPFRHTSNYYLGHCRYGVKNVPHYGGVLLRGIYENIDLRLHFVDGQFKYDFVVRPGGDWRKIAMRIVGVERPQITEDGRLFMDTPLGFYVEEAPVSWLEAADANVDLLASEIHTRTEVPSRFQLDDHRLTFDLDHADKQKSLVIDPGVVFSTYLGGSLSDAVQDVTTDDERNIYVVGSTESNNMPVTAGVIQSNNAGSFDAFVARYTASGELEWLTYFGGGGLDEGKAITIDKSNNLGVAGTTSSANFPATPGAYQELRPGIRDGFVAKLSERGQMRWATYYGGSFADGINDIAADSSNHFCIVGETNARGQDFPLVSEEFNSKDNNFLGGYIARLNSANGNPLWSTYYTANEIDRLEDVAVDRAGNIIAVGQTRGQVVTRGTGILNPTYLSSNDATISVWSPTGRLLRATHFGTTDYEVGLAVAVQPESGNIIVAGETGSTNFPLVDPLQDFGGSENNWGFVSAVAPSLQRIVFSSYISSSSTCSVSAVDVNALDGSITLTGLSNGFDMLVSDDAEQDNLDDGTADRYDAWLWQISADGKELVFGTYYGESQSDIGNSVVFDNIGNIVLVGETNSTAIDMVNAEQMTSNGGNEGFIRKYGCEISTEITPDGPLEFCDGGSVVLEAGDGFESYVWSNGKTTQSILVNGTGDYFVTVRDAGGCEYTTPPTAVSVFPVPDPVIIPDGPTELCNGESVTLDAGAGYETYKWSNDAETQTITVNTSAEYFVTVTGVGGCEAETSIEVNVRPTPTLTLDPVELDWGVLDGCQSSVSLPIILTNNNAFPVRLSDLEFTNNVEFAASNILPNRALAPGEAIRLEIVFTPASTNPVNAEMRIKLSPCDAIVTIPLKGSKGELLVSATPSNIDFGDVLLCGDSQRDTTIVFRNSGNEDVEIRSALFTAPFSVVDNNRLPLTIAPNESDSLRVRFAPVQAGAANIELTVQYVSGSCNDNLRLPLAGLGRDAEVTLRDAAALAFPRIGGCDETSDSELLLELPEGAVGPLRITAIDDVSGQVGGQDALPIELTVAELVRLPLRLTPTSEGVIAGSATITYELDGCEKTLVFDYSGEKRGISITIPSTVDFGSYVSCEVQSLVERVRIEHSGDPVVVSRIMINGDFATTLLEGEEPPEFFDIIFATDEADDVRGSMIIRFDPCGIEREILLIGRRIDLNMSGPADRDFGVVAVAGSDTQTISWTNDGTGPIRIESIDCLVAPFSLVSPAAAEFPIEVGEGEELELVVAFSPTAAGAFEGELCLRSPLPCDLTFRTRLSGRSDEDVVLPGEIDLFIPDLTANPHWDSFDIPIMVRSVSALEDGAIVNARAYVRMNGSVFFPQSLEPGAIVSANRAGGERSLVLDIGPVQPQAGQALGVLRGVPLLGDAVTSTIFLDSVVFVDRDMDVTLADGSLTLDSLCEAGGTRLLTSTTAFGIRSLYPNPAGKEVELVLTGIDTHGAEIEVLDMSGRSLLNRTVGAETEQTLLKLSLSEIPAGSYWIIVRSAFRKDVRQLLVIE